MKMAAHERFALGVVGLLVAVGGLAQLRPRPTAAEWIAADSLGAAAAAPRIHEVEAEVERSRRRALPLRPGERVDPNTADADELQRLPRVGPALAGRIVAHRDAHGPFRSLAELDAVPGVGPALLAGITPHVDLPAGPVGAAAPGAAPGARSGPAAPAASHAGTAPLPIDVNRATPDELQRLPGVGPVLARRIVDWREANGPFRHAAELERVPGIGPRMREKLQPYVRFAP
jgi:competence protein ComEA